MSVIIFVLYVVLAIVTSALIPGAFVILREIIRRRRARRALDKLARARTVIAHLRGESTANLAVTLSRQFDRPTIEAALEEALNEEVACADVCEHLGLRDTWEKNLRQSRSWNARAHAARMLGKLRSGLASKTLLDALVDPHEDSTVRVAAGQALGAIMDEAVIPHLCRALGDYEESSAPTVAEALVDYGEVAVPSILELLSHVRPTARVWAARVLGRIGHSRATSPLLGALTDPDPKVRAAVAEALGLIADMRATGALLTVVLNDPVPPVRANAAMAVAKIGDKDAVRSIVFALRDSDAEVRCRAAEAIALIAPTDWSPLERALFDSCERVRRSAALSLDRLGAVVTWIRALSSPLPEARRIARMALSAVARAGLSKAISSAAAHESAAVRESVANLLRQLGDESDVAAATIASARGATRISLRMRALRELASAGTPEAAAALADSVVSDPAPEARVLAATSLAHCKERWLSLPALARALLDPVSDVAQEAERVLSEYGNDKRDRRTSDVPPDSKGSLRRTTGRMQRQITLV